MSDIASLIDVAVAQLGSQTALGRACGVTQNAIWQARASGRVSAELAVAIDKATEGRVARWQLRPDLWERPTEDAAA